MLEPEILLLDEPTSALDASVQAEVLNLLARLRAERGLTYLMVSHNLAVIDHMCDRLLVMRNGAAVEALDRGALASRWPRTPTPSPSSRRTPTRPSRTTWPTWLTSHRADLKCGGATGTEIQLSPPVRH